LTGLQRTIKDSKGKHSELMTYSGIANILECPYSTARRKVENNSFTVSEAIYLFRFLCESNKFSLFEDMFADKGEK
jgi:hypothetical protein